MVAQSAVHYCASEQLTDTITLFAAVDLGNRRYCNSIPSSNSGTRCTDNLAFFVDYRSIPELWIS